MKLLKMTADQNGKVRFYIEREMEKMDIKILSILQTHKRDEDIYPNAGSPDRSRK